MVSPDSTDRLPRQAAILDVFRVAPAIQLQMLYGIRADGSCSCGGHANCSPGKHPQWSAADFHLDTWLAQDPDCNIGIRLKESGLIDVSTDSEDALADFSSRGLPPTLTIQSSAPYKLHHYYVAPKHWFKDGHRNINVSQQYDLMLDNFAVGAGSKHASGAIYKVVNLRPPVECPQWALDMFDAKKQEREAGQDFLHKFDKEPPIPLTGKMAQRWKGELYSRKDDGTIDRSESIFVMTAYFYRAGLNPWLLFNVIPRWAQRVGIDKFANRKDYDAEWEREITRICQGIGSQAKVEFDDGSRKLIRMAEVAKKPRPSMLVEGLLPKSGVAVFYGSDGTYKSFFGLHLAGCVASGRRILGRQVKQGNVYYLAAEGQGGLGMRADAWLRHYKVQNPDVWFLDGVMPSFDETWLKGFMEAAEENPPVLIIFDTYSKASTGDESSAKDVGDVMNRLIEISNEHDCLFILVHHTGKDEETARGSSKFSRDTDAVYKFVADKNSKEGQIICEKPKDFEKPEPIGFRLQPVMLGEEDEFGASLSTLVIVEPDNPEQEAKEQQQRKSAPGETNVLQAVISLQRANGIGPTRKELAAFLEQAAQGLTAKQLDNVLNRLINKGLVRRDDTSNPLRYYHAPTGDANRPFGSPN